MDILSLIKKYQVQLVFLIICITSLALFYPSLNYYFFQDDWFVLNWVRTGDFKSFLLPQPATIYWRPLSMPLFFWSLYNLFGLNALYFHAFVFFLFFLSLIFIFQLFVLLTESKKVSLVVSALYSTSPVHFMSLSWLSTTSYILMVLLQTISFIFFIKYIGLKKTHFLTLSFTFFIFGILAHEFTIVLPLIMLTWGFLIKKKNYLRIILPFLIIDSIFLFFRFVIFPINAEGNYQIHLNHLIVDNLLWYVAWAYNLPESFKDLIDQSRPVESIKILMGSWRIVLPSLTLVLIIASLLKTNLKKASSQLLFGISWLFLGLSPIITLVNHSFTVYLSFSGIGILFVVATLLKRSKDYLMYAVIVLWIVASYYNLDFTRKTHWVTNEQAVSKAYTVLASDNLKSPESGSVLLIWEADNYFQKKFAFTSSGELDIVQQSLFDQAAMQVIFNDSSIMSFYAKPLQPIKFPPGQTIYDLKPTLKNE